MVYLSTIVATLFAQYFSFRILPIIWGVFDHSEILITSCSISLFSLGLLAGKWKRAIKALSLFCGVIYILMAFYYSTFIQWGLSYFYFRALLLFPFMLTQIVLGCMSNQILYRNKKFIDNYIIINGLGFLMSLALIGITYYFPISYSTGVLGGVLILLPFYLDDWSTSGAKNSNNKLLLKSVVFGLINIVILMFLIGLRFNNFYPTSYDYQVITSISFLYLFFGSFLCRILKISLKGLMFLYFSSLMASLFLTFIVIDLYPGFLGGDFAIVVTAILLLPYMFGSMTLPLFEKINNKSHHLFSFFVGNSLGAFVFFIIMYFDLIPSNINQPYFFKYLERVRGKKIQRVIVQDSYWGKNFNLVDLGGNDFRLSYGGYFVSYRNRNDIFKSEIMKMLSRNRVRKILIMGAGNFLWGAGILNEERIEVDVVDNSPIYKGTLFSKEMLKMSVEDLSSHNMNFIHEDIFTYLTKSDQKYDLVLWNLTYPVYQGAHKFFTTNFSFLVKNVLSKEGIFIVESFENKSIDCTLGRAFSRPYYMRDLKQKSTNDKIVWIYQKAEYMGNSSNKCNNIEKYSLDNLYIQRTFLNSGIIREYYEPEVLGGGPFVRK